LTGSFAGALDRSTQIDLNTSHVGVSRAL